MNTWPPTGKLKNPRPAESEHRFADTQRFSRTRIMTVVSNLTHPRPFRKWENGATELTAIDKVACRRTIQ